MLRAEGSRKITVYRKVKSSIVAETPRTTITIPADSQSDLEISQAALDAAADAGTAEILDLGLDEFPCCAKCGGVRYQEPDESSFTQRHVTIRPPSEVIASGYGTCAEIAVYNAAVTNAKHVAGRSDRTATAELIPDHRGPGRHHAITVNDQGKIGDPIEAADPERPCSLCS